MSWIRPIPCPANQGISSQSPTVSSVARITLNLRSTMSWPRKRVRPISGRSSRRVGTSLRRSFHSLTTRFEQIAGPVASFTGDGAYDRDDVYREVCQRHPDAAVIVPPRSSAVPSACLRRRFCIAKPSDVRETRRPQGQVTEAAYLLPQSRRG